MSADPLYREGCQILVLSSRVELALRLVQKLAEANSRRSTRPSPSLESHPHPPPQAEGSSTSEPPPTSRAAAGSALNPDHLNRLPFLISNKYYTAPLYIQLQPLSTPPAAPLWPPEVDDERARAIIWVFEKHQHNAPLFDTLLPALDAHSPEVRLAIALTSSDTPTSSSAGVTGRGPQGKLEDGLEPFFLEREFEFVDADCPSPGDEREGDALHYDVTGLPRVIESLSTVMWPSMQRLPGGKQPFSLASSLVEPDDPTCALDAPDSSDWREEADDPEEAERAGAGLLQGLSGLEVGVGRDTFEGRLARAEHWETARDEREALEAWLDADEPASTSASRGGKWMVGPSEEAEDEAEFGELVGSPSAVQAGWDALADDDPELEADGPGWAALEDEDEDGLPTETEILSAQVQIFGPPPPGHPTAQPSADPSAAPSAVKDGPSREDLEQAFDLSSALGALQSMRDEIRGMTDEREKRRAAARVALGLVRGLGLHEGEVGEVMRHG